MSRKEWLQQITTVTENMLATLPIPSSSRSPHLLIPTLEIPPLRLARATFQFHSQLVESILLPQIHSLAYAKAQEFSTHYQESYRNICSRLQSSPDTPLEKIVQHLRLTFENLYEREHLPRFLHDAMDAQVKYRCASSHTTKERRAFNHVSLYIFDILSSVNIVELRSIHPFWKIILNIMRIPRLQID